MDDLSDFGAALADLCQKAANERDPDVFADMIERLACALGVTIAWAAQGQPTAIRDLLAGTDIYIADEVARVAPIARLATLRTKQ